MTRRVAATFCLLAAMGLWFPCFCGLAAAAAGSPVPSLDGVPSLGAAGEAGRAHCCRGPLPDSHHAAVPMPDGMPLDDCCCPLGEVPQADRVQQAGSPAAPCGVQPRAGEWQATARPDEALPGSKAARPAHSWAAKAVGLPVAGASGGCALRCSWIR